MTGARVRNGRDFRRLSRGNLALLGSARVGWCSFPGYHHPTHLFLLLQL